MTLATSGRRLIRSPTAVGDGTKWVAAAGSAGARDGRTGGRAGMIGYGTITVTNERH